MCSVRSAHAHTMLQTAHAQKHMMLQYGRHFIVWENIAI